MRKNGAAAQRGQQSTASKILVYIKISNTCKRVFQQGVINKRCRRQIEFVWGCGVFSYRLNPNCEKIPQQDFTLHFTR